MYVGAWKECGDLRYHRNQKNTLKNWRTNSLRDIDSRIENPQIQLGYSTPSGNKNRTKGNVNNGINYEKSSHLKTNSLNFSMVGGYKSNNEFRRSGNSINIYSKAFSKKLSQLRKDELLHDNNAIYNDKNRGQDIDGNDYGQMNEDGHTMLGRNHHLVNGRQQTKSNHISAQRTKSESMSLLPSSSSSLFQFNSKNRMKYKYDDVVDEVEEDGTVKWKYSEESRTSTPAVSSRASSANGEKEKNCENFQESVKPSIDDLRKKMNVKDEADEIVAEENNYYQGIEKNSIFPSCESRQETAFLTTSQNNDNLFVSFPSTAIPRSDSDYAVPRLKEPQDLKSRAANQEREYSNKSNIVHTCNPNINQNLYNSRQAMTLLRVAEKREKCIDNFLKSSISVNDKLNIWKKSKLINLENEKYKDKLVATKTTLGTSYADNKKEREKSVNKVSERKGKPGTDMKLKRFQQVAQMKLAYLNAVEGGRNSSIDTTPEKDKQTADTIDTKLFQAPHDSYGRFDSDKDEEDLLLNKTSLHKFENCHTIEHSDETNFENNANFEDLSYGDDDYDKKTLSDSIDSFAVRNLLEIDDHVEDFNMRETLSRDSYRPQVPSPPPTARFQNRINLSQRAMGKINGTSNDTVNDFEFDFDGISNMLDFTEPSSVNRSFTAGSHKEKNEEKNIDDLLNWAEGL